MSKKKINQITIRSSAAEYLTYVASVGGEESNVEMRYEDENIWLTQKMMAVLYGVSVSAINQHLKRIFVDGELIEAVVIKKYLITAADGKIVKSDVSIAKNYLTEKELSFLERIVSLYLDYAELQAERHIPMSMGDWAKRLDGFLEFNGTEILTGPGKISAEQAKLYAETEFEKYRIIQDRLFMSDYDKFMLKLEEQTKSFLED